MPQPQENLRRYDDTSPTVLGVGRCNLINIYLLYTAIYTYLLYTHTHTHICLQLKRNVLGWGGGGNKPVSPARGSASGTTPRVTGQLSLYQISPQGQKEPPRFICSRTHITLGQYCFVCRAFCLSPVLECTTGPENGTW